MANARAAKPTTPPPRKVEALLQQLWDDKGTDLLLTAGAPPLGRIDGELLPMEGEPLAPEEVLALVEQTLPPPLFKRLAQEKEVDFSFTFGDLARFRGSAFHQRGSVSMTLRLIPLQIPGFDDLGLPKIVEDLVTRPSGLVLVTGPTGSGKSTTLASMIDYINHNRACHILTIEEPLEYMHKHARSAVNQREVGDDTDSFARALRSALREDPDVLLVGEMRDLESIQTALTIAETGHLVFATLHTNDTSQAVDRIIDVFPAERHAQIRVQLASSLAAVIYQRLLPRVDGGLVAAFEIMVATTAVRNLIREGKSRQLRNVVTTSQGDGMRTLESHLSELVAEGVIDYDRACSVSLFPNDVTKPPPVAEPEPGTETETETEPSATESRGRLGRRSGRLG
ncbi:MAG: twitching motility protein PilT [Actinomycetota bacterium]|nr:twitching motility protein PilT [Actinomycetota bacterium]